MSAMHTSTASVACTNLDDLVAFWRAELGEHGLTVDEREPRIFVTDIGYARVAMHAAKSSVCLEVAAKDAALLAEIRGIVAKHLAAFDPSLGVLSWSGEWQVGALPEALVIAQVAACRPVGDSWVRVSVEAEPASFARFARGDWHFRLLRPIRSGREPVWPRLTERGTIGWPQGEDALSQRVFTTRAVDEVAGRLDFDVFRHPDGPTSDWVDGKPLAEPVGLMGPGGGKGPPAAPHLIVGGDETSVPAILRAFEEMPAGARGSCTFLVGTRADIQRVEQTDIEIRWLLRSERASEEDLCNEVIAQTPGPESRVWFAASRDAARKVRSHATSVWGLSKDLVEIVAYWT